MENKELFALMERFEKSSISAMKLQTEAFTVELQKAPPAVVTVAAAAPLVDTVCEQAAPAGEFVKAPLVGTYYGAAAPGKAPYATLGARIAKGQPLCLIEAMKTMNEIPAPCDLVVEEFFAQDGDLVAYDAPILRYSHV